MTASLMMVTYNRLELTKETIDCLFKNTKYPFNLCIVDNNSDDGTIEWAETELLERSLLGDHNCNSVRIKKNKENRGIAIGRNQGLVLANELNDEWLVTIDNDVWVPEGWLTECIDILKANRQFGAIGVNMENKPYPTVTYNGKPFQEKPQGNLGTACMVFNRSLHKLLGYFNCKDYEFYAHEDADWGMRVRVLGLKLGYIREMGRHLGEGDKDQGEYREFKNEWHGRNLPKFHKNARDYMRRAKSYYISFKDAD